MQAEMEKSALPKASKDTRVTVTDPVMQRGATGSQVRSCFPMVTWLIFSLSSVAHEVLNDAVYILQGDHANYKSQV